MSIDVVEERENDVMVASWAVIQDVASGNIAAWVEESPPHNRIHFQRYIVSLRSPDPATETEDLTVRLDVFERAIRSLEAAERGTTVDLPGTRGGKINSRLVKNNGTVSHRMPCGERHTFRLADLVLLLEWAKE